MYLKSIEVQGFKSFANKIIFKFHQGITGIVGPNGSGKSNVADAVRWVLGEQRIKQLRGESMQDVIFSGTELRKPLGYAYVGITFDNADHKLEKQVEPLEKQSEKAKVYLKKKEELKELDVNMFLLENKKLKEQLSDVEGKYSIAQEDFENTVKQYENIKVEYDAVQTHIEELEQEIETARNTLTDASVTRGKLEGEINVLKEQIKGAQGNEHHFRERIAAIQEQITEKESERAKILESKTALDEKVAELEKERNEAKGTLTEVQTRIEELNAKIESDKNQIIAMLNERATIKSKMSSFDTMMEQIIEVNTNLTEMEERGKTFRERLGKKDEEIREAQGAYQRYKSKLDTISNLTERYEGYGNSIQKVMEQREQNKGIVGVVADIIKVDKQYETAIETALGGNIQNIVTTDEDTAKKMIGFLKKNRFGRATFLPLTSITKPQEFKTLDVLKEKGAIGLADTLVKTDVKYKNVAKAMLGRIAVIDTIDNAVRIARKYDYSVRMVTLEGELLVPGGAISGGAFKNNSNLLGRRRELEELEEKLKDAKKRLEAATEDIENIKTERSNLRKAIEDEKAVLQELFIKQNTARLNVVTAEERKNEAEQGFGSLKDEQHEIDEKVSEINADKERTIHDLRVSEENEKLLEQGIAACQRELENYRTEESNKTGLVGEWDVAYEKMLQKQEFEQTNLNRIEGELSRSREELIEVQTSLDSCLKDIEIREKNVEEIVKTIDASHTTQSDAETSLKEKQQEKEELSQKQKNFFRTREEISEKKNALDKEVYRLGSQQEKLEETVENQINYMWNEYEITLNNAASMRNEALTDISEMKKQIVSIKDDIRKLGDVNVNAIEDYKVLMDRYTFMKNQHDDLIEAEKTLEGIIEELDTAMRKQFAEKFEEIKREFDKVFKELFGGGKGTLELIEDEDILEAGIRIIAQPPGKKLQNMMQLSGGEKSFTAIALLFAIQNLKPSPFCLLDEIEAALDEGNVSRFAKYLNKLTKSTQFIVITHRRGTMEQADRLYGITMQEKGVSTLVSVNLVDSEVDSWSQEGIENKDKNGG